MPDSRWRRALALLFPALLPSLQLFLFGPHTLYAGNPEEFSAPFSSILVHLAPMILGVTGVLILLGLALPERFYRHYLVGLVGLGLVLWIQGNLIVGDYGVLNGEDIDWSGTGLAKSLRTGALDRAAAPRHHFRAAAIYRVGVREPYPVALQAALLVVTAAKANPEARAKWEGPPDAIFEASSTQNVFHFVLDGFQSDVFLDIIEAERADMDRSFSGFTFFAESRRGVPDDNRQHPDDADRTALPEPGTDAPVHRIGASSVDRFSG